MDTLGCILAGALLGGLGVFAGAYHAHGLQGYLTARETDLQVVAARMSQFEVAVRYQMYHALALIAVGLVAARRPSRSIRVAAWGFLLGVLIFSGFLYALVFTGITRFGMIVPIGGVALMVGWSALFVAALGERKPRPANEA